MCAPAWTEDRLIGPARCGHGLNQRLLHGLDIEFVVEHLTVYLTKFIKRIDSVRAFIEIKSQAKSLLYSRLGKLVSATFYSTTR